MISIVLPTYNGEKYIRESIYSIIAQTYKDWELIVIDDCSTDNTNKIVKSYCEIDSRIKLYKNENNLRLPRSLNKGFSLSKGDYLTWTSDDNIYKPNALEDLLNNIVKLKVDFVFSAMDYIDESGKVTHSSKKPEDLSMIYATNIVGACFLYTRNVYKKIGDYNPNLFMIEDYDYWIRIYKEYKTAYIDKSLYLYRQHSGSLTISKNKKLLEVKIPFFENILKNTELSDKNKAKIYNEIILSALGINDIKLMRKYLKLEKSIPKEKRVSHPKKVYIANILGSTLTSILKKLK